MRFEIIMNMPVRGDPDSNRSPSLIHRLIVEHPAKSLEAFAHELMNYDFIIVDSFI